jgi:hypothetical protein
VATARQEPIRRAVSIDLEHVDPTTLVHARELVSNLIRGNAEVRSYLLVRERAMLLQQLKNRPSIPWPTA